jgi:two-component system, OmpR family, KDP operon response regulator KdpE
MSSGLSILVVDDDPAIRRYIRRSFGAEHCQVRDMAPGRSALERISEQDLDLVILGLDGAAAGGPDIIRTVRELSSVPIVAISTRDDEDSLIEALESGADDYVTQPFRIRTLIARSRTVLRRVLRERGYPPRFISGDLEIDLVTRRVWSRGHKIHLAAKPYAVLRLLVERAGQVLSHDELLSSVWGPKRIDRVSYLRLTIRELRRALEADPAHPLHIITEMGVGYRLQVPRRGIRGTLKSDTSGHSDD